MSISTQIETLSFHPSAVAITSAAPTHQLLVPPARQVAGQLAALSAAGDFNVASDQLPTEGDFGKLIRVAGANNFCMRPYLLKSGSALTAGTENSVVRIWGVAAAAAVPNPRVSPAEPTPLVFGQYFGEVTCGTAALLALPAGSPLNWLSGGPPTDTSWCDLITPTAGNPHTGFDTTLGAAGSGRWLRIRDLLGWPALFVQWRNSSSAVALGAEIQKF